MKPISLLYYTPEQAAELYDNLDRSDNPGPEYILIARSFFAWVQTEDPAVLVSLLSHSKRPRPLFDLGTFSLGTKSDTECSVPVGKIIDILDASVSLVPLEQLTAWFMQTINIMSNVGRTAHEFQEMFNRFSCNSVIDYLMAHLLQEPTILMNFANELQKNDYRFSIPPLVRYIDPRTTVRLLGRAISEGPASANLLSLLFGLSARPEHSYRCHPSFVYDISLLDADLYSDYNSDDFIHFLISERTLTHFAQTCVTLNGLAFYFSRHKVKNQKTIMKRIGLRDYEIYTVTKQVDQFSKMLTSENTAPSMPLSQG